MTASSSPANDAVPQLRRPSRWRIWLQAVRVFSFPASVVPIIVAAALAAAAGAFDAPLVVLMLVASVACHAGANLANDYYDDRRGLDTVDSLGPSKVIQQGLLSPAEVRRGMVVAFGIATLLGLVVVAVRGWPVFVLALLCLGAAYFYTGGPRPLGYVALGELTVALAMGLGMVGGAYYVLAGRVTTPVVLAALAVACLVAAILHANNLRDLEGDRAADKVTLATLLGRRNADREYAVLLAGAYVAVVLVAVVERGWWPVLLVFTSLPRAVGLVRAAYAAATPAALNPVVRGTAALHLRFGLLLAGGILVAALVAR
jgi:1,4-dihydroxy-2-naphthoate octaprenyltransferase